MSRLLFAAAFASLGLATAAAAQTPPVATAQPPVYEQGRSRPLSLDLAGNLRVVPSAGPAQPATGYLSASATSSAASALVVRASAGNLYDWQVTAGASAGYVMIFNATSAPADGTVAPVQCVAVAANASVGSSLQTLPERFTTGIVIVFSTTGCFTKTASATAFIRARSS